MADIRTLKLNLLADVDNFNKALKATQSKFDKFSQSLDQMGRKASVALGGLAFAGFKAVQAAEDAAVANQRLDNVLNQMGFEKSTKRAIAYAEALEQTTTVDAEVIKLTQAKLATFSNLTKTIDIAGGSFDRATKAALDMAAAGFGSAENNAVQLGKALQDPIKGINALSKSGITFTEQEQKLIKTLVESGDILKAQDIVLKAIEAQVGGTAEATATASAKMKVAFNGLSESIGQILLPYFERFTQIVTKFTPILVENADVIIKVAVAIGGLAVAVKTVQFGLEAFSAAIKLATALQWLFNIALNANPIGLIILAITALGVAFVAAYKYIEPFRNLIDSIYEAVKRLVDLIANSAIFQKLSSIVGSLPGLSSASVGSSSSGTFAAPTAAQQAALNQGNVVINLNGVVDGESARRSIEKVLQNSGSRTSPVKLARLAL
jgi:hypothetical protein